MWWMLSYAVRITKDNFYDINDRWQQSDWVENRQHLLLDFFGLAPTHLPRLSPDDPLPAPASTAYPGVVLSEQTSDQDYQAEIQAARSSYVLFKMTWHPNWHATVDGAPVETGDAFARIHRRSCHRGPSQNRDSVPGRTWKPWLAILGLLLVCGVAVAEWRGFIPHLDFAIPRFAQRTALGLIALAMPVCVSLITSKLPNGHDATEYLPRMVEFHENIAHGILLPRWAPDLSRGTGQPLFLFNPPMFYYLGEFWHLLGFDFVKSINLAAIAIVIASAFGMFLLGRLYFGPTGGWLAAAAYLYAPYFAVDLYVRSALAEFSAFPFFAFALYGFGAYAKFGRRPYLLIGAAAFAGVLLCHNPAALLFAPMLGALILFQRGLRNRGSCFSTNAPVSRSAWRSRPSSGSRASRRTNTSK